MPTAPDDNPYACRFGYHHAVPSLAAQCSGVTHGLSDHINEE
jgi:hypothetical protein